MIVASIEVTSVSICRPLLVVALAATVLSSPPAATAHQATMTRERFLATKWRLTGLVFQILPVDGFPIAFRADGTVETRNLGGITTWTLEEDELILLDDRHRADHRFKWAPARGVFRDCVLPSKPAFVIFPEGARNPLNSCDDVLAAVLTLRIALDKTVYQPGERIVATATLSNTGNAPIDVRRSADETGYADGFRVELSKDGANAQPPLPPPPLAGIGVSEPLVPGGTNSRPLVLNGLLGSLKPGKYRLTITYRAHYPERDIGIGSDPITLEIMSPK